MEGIHKTIYNVANTELTPASPTGGMGINNVEVSVTNNMENSITNPKLFFMGIPLNDYDWYSALADVHNDYLWNDANGNKGIYDPCPDGWRVPKTTGEFTSPWMGLPVTTFTDGFNWTSIGAGHYPCSRYKMRDGTHDMYGAMR